MNDTFALFAAPPSVICQKPSPWRRQTYHRIVRMTMSHRNGPPGAHSRFQRLAEKSLAFYSSRRKGSLTHVTSPISPMDSL
ncbi:Uncharacterized protein HZ326_21898 [Fusarium oxysporum f. sp. albedinis]|nr:Uncharacterized protein HZ326_21898 [Fusarium oxysporum f. sp. albedinis]